VASLAVPSIAPGASASVTRVVWMPPAPMPTDSGLRSYPVRVALSSPALTRADTLHVRPGSAAVLGGCAFAGAPSAQRYGIGPVRVRMRVDALRAACPEARDSAWSRDRQRFRGLAVRIGEVPVLAEVAGDTVVRVLVSDPGVRTAAGLSVGMRLADLRARYGSPCATRAEGTVLVRFPSAPGLSFALDSVTTREWLPTSRVEDLPDSARVDGLAVHAIDLRCP
jgi:hypothetical protein